MITTVAYFIAVHESSVSVACESSNENSHHDTIYAAIGDLTVGAPKGPDFYINFSYRKNLNKKLYYLCLDVFIDAICHPNYEDILRDMTECCLLFFQ